MSCVFAGRNRRCASPNCCSKEGWCGAGLLWCDASLCQVGYGVCNPATPTRKPYPKKMAKKN